MKSLSTFCSFLLLPTMAVLPLQADMATNGPGAAPAVEASVPTAVTPSGQTSSLRIRLANAGNASVEAGTSLQGYAIQVTDGSGLPAVGVAVAIRLPEDGATGFFADGAHSAVAYTDVSGTATFAQINWGSTLGLATIRVTAVKGEQRASAVIEQTLVTHSASTSQQKAEARALTASALPPATQTGSSAPGVPATVAAVHSGAAPDQVANSSAAKPAQEPVVSIVNSGGSHSSVNKKWIIVAAVAAGVGVGAALALSGHGTSAPAAGIGLSIGSPTVSVGH